MSKRLVIFIQHVITSEMHVCYHTHGRNTVRHLQCQQLHLPKGALWQTERPLPWSRMPLRYDWL